MPKINDNERRLLLVLGAVVFLAANVLGFFLVNNVMKGIASQEKQLKERLRDLETAREQAAEATEKEEWTAQHFKGYPNEEYRETYLDGIVNGELTTGLNVDLSKPSVLPTDTSGEFVIRSKFRVTVKGPWTDVWKFIYRLQKPEEFRFVPRISVTPKKSEADDSLQLAEAQVEIEKWWPRPDSFVPAGENVSPENEQGGGDAVNTGADVSANANGPGTPASTGDKPGSPASGGPPAAPTDSKPSTSSTNPPAPEASPDASPADNPSKPNS